MAERIGLMPGIQDRVLHELGLSYVDGDGRVFGRMSMADFEGKGAVAEIEIARGDLDEVLLEALAAANEAAPNLLDLRYGDHITALTQDADGVDVVFEHAPAERFDLVVGADGVHSATRRLAFGPEEEYSTYLGGYAAFFTMATPRTSSRAGSRCGSCRARPSGSAPTSTRRPPRRSSPCASTATRAARRPGRTRGAGPPGPRGRGMARPTVLEAMPGASDFYFDELARIDVPEVANGRVALIGDAGTCGSPISGMGTATALIGAYLLAARIAETPGDLAAAAQRYASDIVPFAEAARSSWAAASSAWCPPTGSRRWCRGRRRASCSPGRRARSCSGCSPRTRPTSPARHGNASRCHGRRDALSGRPERTARARRGSCQNRSGLGSRWF
ncbi:FAD-dependent monooxygenase [Oerskovia sp. M15]